MAVINKLHPGVYIKNAIETMGITFKEFSTKTGISEKTLSAIINDKKEITYDIATKLSDFFDSSISYWMNLQTQYNLNSK